MGYAFSDIAFTPGVKALQTAAGSRASYARLEASADDRGATLTDAEAAFLAERDSFYMATVSETGWPYLQHRGGPAGFVKVLDEKTIGFADFAGNRQFISVGNLGGNDRVSLFFMHYAARQRLKVLGRARFVEADDAGTLAKLALPGYRGRVERGVVIDVAAFDWNCPQHITPRYSQADVEHVVGGLQSRIAELEQRLAQADRA
jgi:predicted pyridoxine 5'-phosphate oxidase superfamily flavin-nucleotide-binding protein